MKIKLTDPVFGEHTGKIITGALDASDNSVRVDGLETEQMLNRAWIFSSEYIQVEDEVEYTVTLKIKDLLELRDLLQTLPRFLVETATLTKN